LYLERPRINEQIRGALDYPVILVIGGAGYGKSHGIYTYLQKHRVRTVWIQLTERDNISDRFWENFIQSVSMINGESAGRLAKQGFPATDREFEQYLAIPLADVNPRVKMVFVYDDVHLIQDKSVLRFLERSIAIPFPSITSILITRKELAINLMKLYSKGLLASISEDDLRFTRDELEAFFAMIGIKAPQDTIDQVYHNTEGWAFAVHLSGIHFMQIPSGAGFESQIRLNMYKLIESEIMARVDDELRKFLIKLALIEESPPELIRELARCQEGDCDTSGKEGCLIRRIEQIGSLIRLDEYRHVFSIHRLFRDYLRGLQNELSEEEKKEVYQAAAAWCVRNNLRIDAILYYEKAKDYEKLIAQCHALPLGLPASTMNPLRAVLERFPKEIYLERADVYVVLVRFLLNSGKLNETVERIKAIIKTQEARPPCRAREGALFYCYITLGFLAEILAVLEGDFSFPAHFEKAHYHKDRWGEEADGPFTITNLGSYVCRVPSPDPKEMDRYFAALTAAIPHAAACLRGSMYGMEELARGELALFRMEMDRAENFLRESLVKARAWHQHEIEVRCYFYLLRIGCFQGDIELIRESQKGIQDILNQEEYANRRANHDIYWGWFYAQIGECERVPVWLTVENEESPNSLIRGQELLVKARYFFQEKNYAGTLLSLKRTKHNALHFILGKIEIKVLEAVSLYQMKQRAAAYAVLEEARLLAEPGGLLLPFAEMGKDTRSVASQALKDDSSNPRPPEEFLEKIRNLSSVYAKKLGAVREQFSAKGNHPSPFAKLSHKEYEVLEALFQGFTQEEIAKSSSRSANTIKSAIKRIYEKLGAVNRADAIRIALSRGLLEWGNQKPSSPPPASSAPHPRQPLIKKAPQASAG
jgi:LuxR family maltose regulon positive regulatory protein